MRIALARLDGDQILFIDSVNVTDQTTASLEFDKIRQGDYIAFYQVQWDIEHASMDREIALSLKVQGGSASQITKLDVKKDLNISVIKTFLKWISYRDYVREDYNQPSLKFNNLAISK